MAVKTFADDEQPLLNEQPKSSLTRVAVLAVACSFVLGSVAGTVYRGGHPCGNTRRTPSTRRWPRESNTWSTTLTIDATPRLQIARYKFSPQAASEP